ncbi:MAG: hypothetical protein HWE30_13235 [Methylocystaceae bacterium]|nr:hypothetical protein [Methylocystaceae bacterium]
MYQSRQYLEICGKLVASPFCENDTLYGVSLHRLLCALHESGAQTMTDFKAILMGAIEVEIGLEDMSKVFDIYHNILDKLSEQGLQPDLMTH